MDRTAEFQRIIAERQSRRQGASSSSAPPPTIPLAPPTRTEFAAAASQIGSSISAVADKLGKLTQLAQSRSLFDEEGQGQEISALTFIIKQDITALNSRLNELQQAQRQRPRGARAARNFTNPARTNQPLCVKRSKAAWQLHGFPRLSEVHEVLQQFQVAVSRWRTRRQGKFRPPESTGGP